MPQSCKIGCVYKTLFVNPVTCYYSLLNLLVQPQYINKMLVANPDIIYGLYSTNTNVLDIYGQQHTRGQLTHQNEFNHNG